jgi:hypothetical protein
MFTVPMIAMLVGYGLDSGIHIEAFSLRVQEDPLLGRHCGQERREVLLGVRHIHFVRDEYIGSAWVLAGTKKEHQELSAVVCIL